MRRRGKLALFRPRFVIVVCLRANRSCERVVRVLLQTRKLDNMMIIISTAGKKVSPSWKKAAGSQELKTYSDLHTLTFTCLNSDLLLLVHQIHNIQTHEHLNVLHFPNCCFKSLLFLKIYILLLLLFLIIVPGRVQFRCSAMRDGNKGFQFDTHAVKRHTHLRSYTGIRGFV